MSGHTSRECTAERDENASSGFSLSAVLVFMLIVSAIIVPFAVTAKTQLMIANNEVEQERLRLIAEGVGNVVASQLTGDASGGNFRSISHRWLAGRENSASTYAFRIMPD